MRRTLLLLATMVTGVLLVSGVAYALSVQCDGTGDQDPDPGECQGTPNADNISGTFGAEVIKALAGNDVVDPDVGMDEVYGARGNDVVDGYHGRDTIYGGSGNDGSAEGTSFKTPTKDTTNLEGGEDSDKVYGGEGDDWIDAAAHDTTGSLDRSYGEEGNDRIYAIDGNEDIINCGPGTDDLVRRDVGIDTINNCEERRSQ
jgi:Ca2+-binding RTX toxin-like protein